jgi:hypothetical protein
MHTNAIRGQTLSYEALDLRTARQSISLLIFLVFTMLFLCLALGCSNVVISEAALARHIDSQNKPVDTTNIFRMDDENIYCSFKLEGVKSTTVLTVECVLVESDYSDIPPIVWFRDTVTSLSSGYSTYMIPRPSKLFPRGNHQVILYLNGKKKVVLPFKVEKPPNQDVILAEVDDSTQKSGGVRTVYYDWVFEDQTRHAYLEIPNSLCNFFNNIDRISTSDPTKYSIYVTNTYDDYYIGKLASGLKQMSSANGFNLDDELHFIISFVQGLPYKVDKENTPYAEYPKYPIETLADKGGDCEDKSILLASILQAMHIDNVLLIMREPDHCAVGIAVKGVTGFGVEHNGVIYYYVETTNLGYSIGEIPSVYIGKVPDIAVLHPISQVQFRKPGEYGTYHVQGKVIQVVIDIINIGSTDARDVYLITGFEGENNQIVNEQRTKNFALPPNWTATATFYLDIPYVEDNRLVIKIMQDGQEIKSGYADIDATNASIAYK